jgi:hypothetical protein
VTRRNRRNSRDMLAAQKLATEEEGDEQRRHDEAISYAQVLTVWRACCCHSWLSVARACLSHLLDVGGQPGASGLPARSFCCAMLDRP